MQITRKRSPRSAATSAFTLAEVAVTIVIVGIGLVLVLQGLNTAKLTAAHTANQKAAREFALLTLGEIGAGLYWEEELEHMTGSYAEQGRADFYFEVKLGDDTFSEMESGDPDAPFDMWAYNRELEQERDDYDEDEEDEVEQPYEKVTVRVTFPPIRELNNEVTIERWIPWKQVYGESEDSEGEGINDPLGDQGGIGEQG